MVHHNTECGPALPCKACQADANTSVSSGVLVGAIFARGLQQFQCQQEMQDPLSEDHRRCRPASEQLPTGASGAANAEIIQSGLI